MDLSYLPRSSNCKLLMRSQWLTIRIKNKLQQNTIGKRYRLLNIFYKIYCFYTQKSLRPKKDYPLFPTIKITRYNAFNFIVKWIMHENTICQHVTRA